MWVTPFPLKLAVSSWRVVAVRGTASAFIFVSCPSSVTALADFQQDPNARQGRVNFWRKQAPATNSSLGNQSITTELTRDPRAKSRRVHS